MRPRPPRLVVDNTRPPFPPPPPPPPIAPRWSARDIEYAVNRALDLTRDVSLPRAEKERIIRDYLAEDQE